MSLKRRNLIALILLLAAAICWTYGQQPNTQTESGIHATTFPTTPLEYWETSYLSTTVAATEYAEPFGTTIQPTHGVYQNTPPADSPTQKLLNIVLSLSAAILAITAIFLLWQKTPFMGFDGLCAIYALLASVKYFVQREVIIVWSSGFQSTAATMAQIINVWVVLLGLRELFGWLRARFSLSWCFIHRLSMHSAKPQATLLCLVGWIIAVLGMFFWHIMAAVTDLAFPFYGYLAAAFLGLICLWRYGTDLCHFKAQLDCFRQGQPVNVGNGAFSQTEAQLSDVQVQHEEAVRTAVTSERFKVELIANVSHDLRTPLTSILGYSELLQKEALSPEGQEQLQRLHQKAGYMNELVEALFELTKVSSGAVETKKEQIDLIRLLEQTIGLLDDRLTQAGLTVKRNYPCTSVPVITDGARMHQVFANLLGNAIKYALPGTRIYLELKQTPTHVCVRMLNTASYEMDFTPDEIMQRFARGDKARSTKGSGLGLAIAQTYTQSVGGMFRVGVDGDQFSAIVELPKTERDL